MIEPLPEELCAMGPLFRDVYTVQDPVIEKAAVPILMRHRDFIYERHLELPIDLKSRNVGCSLSLSYRRPFSSNIRPRPTQALQNARS